MRPNPYWAKVRDRPSSPAVMGASGTRTRKWPTWLKARLSRAKQAPVVRTRMGPRMAPTSAAQRMPLRMASQGFGLQ